MTPLPPIPDQLDRLIALDVPALAGLSDDAFRAIFEDIRDTASPTTRHPLVALHPSLVPAHALAPLLVRDGEPGFVVVDWTDLEEFVSTVPLPVMPLYLVNDVERGDEFRGVSPDEALSAIDARGRTPLTLHEGISWLLQQPEALEPNYCFMCIGTRKATARGTFDARTPALWISSGTGRDGAERRNAPKIGWCWWRNRHDWLGIASAAERSQALGPVGARSAAVRSY